MKVEISCEPAGNNSNTQSKGWVTFWGDNFGHVALIYNKAYGIKKSENEVYINHGTTFLTHLSSRVQYFSSWSAVKQPHFTETSNNSAAFIINSSTAYISETGGTTISICHELNIRGHGSAGSRKSLTTGTLLTGK